MAKIEIEKKEHKSLDRVNIINCLMLHLFYTLTFNCGKLEHIVLMMYLEHMDIVNQYVFPWLVAN